jgi:hypothetical protein
MAVDICRSFIDSETIMIEHAPTVIFLPIETFRSGLDLWPPPDGRDEASQIPTQLLGLSVALPIDRCMK